MRTPTRFLYAYLGRWTFTKDLWSNGIDLGVGDKFSFLVQDNLTDLTFMSFKLKGVIEDA